MKKIQWIPLLVCLLISLGVGALSGWISSPSYAGMNTPPLQPPAWLFPIVWTILFTVMGITSYLVYTSDAVYDDKKRALSLYGIQLAVNFLWPIIFFNFQLYTLAFVWIVLLWGLVVITTIAFYRIRPIAGLLWIPYILWVTFAAYLNLAIILLN